MLLSESLNYILIVSIVTGCISGYFLFSFLGNLRKIKVLASVRKFTGLLIFSLATASTSFLLIGIQGYQALTHEQMIAKVSIVPNGSQHFVATIRFENGVEQLFHLAGDEVMFEANVLKWKPWSNVVGLKTAYRLDRVRGRYVSIEDEKNKPITLFPLVEGPSSDIADWREQYQPLSLLLDVEHGSASFASADHKRSFDLMMTTNGLLLRPVGE
jgi:hypothetical protein